MKEKEVKELKQRGYDLSELVHEEKKEIRTLGDYKKTFAYICNSCGVISNTFAQYCYNCGTKDTLRKVIILNYEKERMNQEISTKAKQGIALCIITNIITFILLILALLY